MVVQQPGNHAMPFVGYPHPHSHESVTSLLLASNKAASALMEAAQRLTSCLLLVDFHQIVTRYTEQSEIDVFSDY